MVAYLGPVLVQHWRQVLFLKRKKDASYTTLWLANIAITTELRVYFGIEGIFYSLASLLKSLIKERGDSQTITEETI